MATKTQFICQSCGATFPKWQGKCSDCGEWNSLVEEVLPNKSVNKKTSANYAGVFDAKIQKLSEVKIIEETINPTGISEFDRVLGGGLVLGSVVLIGGEPGIGKSTLLLQTIHQIAKKIPCLYVSGEESPSQISLRAKRLNLDSESILLFSETQIEIILAATEKLKPQVLVIDSIQTLFSENLNSAAGAIGQLRECTAQLVRYAKTTGTTIFLIGHITKDGSIAGPKVLEHMVDTVLYFESEAGSRYRMLRAIKNRFGAVNELGMFAMLEDGLKEVKNPSAIFLARPDKSQSGSAIFPAWEGSRVILLEIQSLVDTNNGNYARRVVQGFDANRLNMLLAVLNRHGNISMHDLDVFVNVVGGLKISETASDLAVIAAAISSLKNKAIPPDVAIFGEIGLAGELRPAPNGEARIKTAQMHGFKKIILPLSNKPRKEENIKCYPVATLSEALDKLNEME